MSLTSAHSRLLRRFDADELAQVLAAAGKGTDSIQERQDPVVQRLRDEFPYFQGVRYRNTDGDSESSAPWSQESAFDAAGSNLVPTWIVTDFDAPRSSRQRVRRILLVVPAPSETDQTPMATCPCRINLTFVGSACYGVALVPALAIDAQTITRFRGRQRW